MNMEIALLVVSAYLIGSISTSVWISKLFFDIDIREYGSGNAGTTNTFRVLGKKPGMVVFLIDVLKGVAATQVVHLLHSDIIVNNSLFFQILAGIFAVLGHIFPLYTGFKGGKGVATLLGICLGFVTVPTIVAAGVFTIVFLISGYVSLGSMTAGISFPVLVLVFFHYTALSITIFAVTIPVLLIITHKKNIIRLIHREENRFKIVKRRRFD